MSGFILRPDELKKNFKNYIILDCRENMSDSEHISGSYFVDGESVLSGKKGLHGGRHPFPDMDEFVKKMEDLGVSDSSKAACFGDFGARAVFMLRLFGITASFISGDIETLKKAGIPFDNDNVAPVLKKGKITGKINEDLLVSMGKVRKNINNTQHILIDSRSGERYRGENEPLDPIAGRIPNAVNFFWQELIKPDGTVLSDEEIRERFNIDTGKNITLYCGSGVTACFNWLALRQIGVECSIYAGSWSDWISYPENLDLIEPKIH
ncbi:MAG TPA: rhodanese-like domain-containing protein [bacterium]|nr:rhodanese-like domain-containing protein [bacterium]